MSARHAVLGLVIERPGYGYQLGQRLAERCGAWDWESSGVYGALNSLQRDGYVRSSTEKGTGATGRAAPRAIYEATGAGVDYFRAWIIAFSPPSPVRQELDLKILFSGSPVPAGQGGAGLSSGALCRQKRLRQPRPARGRGPAPDA